MDGLTRTEAQALLDDVEPGHALARQEMRDRYGELRSVVVRWRGAHALRATEAAALRALVDAVYREHGRPAPEGAS